MDFCTRFSDHPHPKLTCGVSKTDQSFKSECEVDRILYKYTHHLPLHDWQMKTSPGSYADVTQVPTDPAQYREWSEMVQEKFSELPAELRRAYKDNAFEFAAQLATDPNDLAKRLDVLLKTDKERLNPTLSRIDKLIEKLDAKTETHSSMPTQSSQTPSTPIPENKE